MFVEQRWESILKVRTRRLKDCGTKNTDEEDEVGELAVGENEITYAPINYINNTFV